MTGADRGVSRDVGDAGGLGFTFGLQTRWLLERSEGEGKEGGKAQGEESYGEILENDFMPAFHGPREQRMRDARRTHLE